MRRPPVKPFLPGEEIRGVGEGAGGKIGRSGVGERGMKRRRALFYAHIKELTPSVAALLCGRSSFLVSDALSSPFRRACCGFTLQWGSRMVWERVLRQAILLLLERPSRAFRRPRRRRRLGAAAKARLFALRSNTSGRREWRCPGSLGIRPGAAAPRWHHFHAASRQK